MGIETLIETNDPNIYGKDECEETRPKGSDLR